MQLCLPFSPSPNSLRNVENSGPLQWEGANGRKEFAAQPNHHDKGHLPNRYICLGLCCD